LNGWLVKSTAFPASHRLLSRLATLHPFWIGTVGHGVLLSGTWQLGIDPSHHFPSRSPNKNFQPVASSFFRLIFFGLETSFLESVKPFQR
jgi:hypothetical protein